VKRILTISVLLLVLGGCATSSNLFVAEPLDGVQSSDGWVEWKELYRPLASSVFTYDEEAKALGPSSKIFYKVNKENQMIFFKASGKPIYGHVDGKCGFQTKMKGEMPKLCYDNFGGGIRKLPEIAKTAGFTCNFGIAADFHASFVKNKDFSVQCYTPETAQKEKEEANKYRLEQIVLFEAKALEEKKNKCKDYGFKDNTDGMGLCLIELDKLAKIEEQILAIEKRNNQVYLQNQQQIADQKRQREAQALINLGAVISGAGTPRRTTPKAPITTYPNSFSSTLTVPSNQVCPILSTPITKQEVRGTNRICYYQ
jgi:hypothetical protein